MRHRLFTILASLSLLLCVVIAALWARSYFRSDILIIGEITSNMSWRHYGVCHSRGLVMVGSGWEPHDPLGVDEIQFIVGEDDWGILRCESHAPIATAYVTGPLPDVLGFQLLINQAPTIVFRFRNLLMVPFWALVVLFAALPAFRFLKLSDRRRRSRIARGLCAGCGYNLTGNVSVVCPECGTAIPPGAEIKRVTA